MTCGIISFFIRLLYANDVLLTRKIFNDKKLHSSGRRSNRPQIEIGDFRRATDAAGEPAAVATVDVAIGLAFLYHAPRVLEYGEQRQAEDAELAAVSVAGERQGDRAFGGEVDEVGVMREEHGRCACWQFFQGFFHVFFAEVREVRPVHRVVDAGEKDAAAGDLAAFVDEDLHARVREVFEDGCHAAEVLVVAEAVPNAVGKCIDVAFEQSGGLMVLCVVVKEVAGDGQKVGLRGSRTLQERFKVSHRKEGAQMDVAELCDAVAVFGQVMHGNVVGAFNQGIALDEAAVEAQSRRGSGIDGGFAEQPAPALVDGHGHHAAPQAADKDGQHHEDTADELCENECDDELEQEGIAAYLMVARHMEHEPGNRDDIECQDSQAGIEEFPARQQVAHRPDQEKEQHRQKRYDNQCEPGQTNHLKTPCFEGISSMCGKSISNTRESCSAFFWHRTEKLRFENRI